MTYKKFHSASGWLSLAVLLLCLSVLAACSSGPPEDLPMPSSAPGEPGALAASGGMAYTLGSGDRLRVIVFGEEDLSGEFEVGAEGMVAMPLVGQVKAGGRTLREFEAAVEAKLEEGYLREPRVSAEVLNYRPFYIIGEVQEGGEYPYVSGMNVLNAVAVAGGYTYRANTGKVYITREGVGREIEMPATQRTKVLPGDVIRVPERFF